MWRTILEGKGKGCDSSTFWRILSVRSVPNFMFVIGTLRCCALI